VGGTPVEVGREGERAGLGWNLHKAKTRNIVSVRKRDLGEKGEKIREFATHQREMFKRKRKRFSIEAREGLPLPRSCRRGTAVMEGNKRLVQGRHELKKGN